MGAWSRLPLLLVVACVRQLPAAPTPPPVAPSLGDAPPLAPGQGRIVVDVVDGPTPVERVAMTPHQEGTSFSFSEDPQTLCDPSPCVTDVPLGNVLLGFPVIGKPGDLEIELVHVGDQPTVYRRSLSVYENHTGALRVLGIVAASVGSAADITGIVLLPIGLSKEMNGLTAAGGITLGVGALVTAFGIWAIRHDAPTFRPGSSNHFPLAH